MKQAFGVATVAFAMVAFSAGSQGASDSDAERKDLFGLIQREIDEVSPNDFRTYCQYDVPLSSYVRQTGEPQFAALRRLDDACHKVVREVRATRIPKGAPPVVWYVYNMGIVVKTSKTLFSVDLQHRFAEMLAPELDFALITHNHMDHYTRRFYETMNNRLHKTVVTNFADNYGAHHGGAVGGFTKGGRTFTIGDAVVKTASSDHNGYLVDFTLTFEIAVNGYRIFHSGDSANIDKLNPVNAPDLWIVHPLCGLDPAKGVEKFRPKLTAVVHLNEMSHAKDRWRHTYESGLACVKKIEAAGGKTVMPLWGERLGLGV